MRAPATPMAKIRAVQQEALELFLRKNADYGDAYKTYGPVGVIVRIGDKIARLASVSRTEVRMVDDETLRDTLIDLHNYAAMAIALMDEPPPQAMHRRVAELKGDRLERFQEEEAIRLSATEQAPTNSL